MDKKNVQNRIAEKVLTEKKFSYDIEILSSQIKRQFFILLLKNFIFFYKKYLGTFYVDNIYQHVEKV